MICVAWKEGQVNLSAQGCQPMETTGSLDTNSDPGKLQPICPFSTGKLHFPLQLDKYILILFGVCTSWKFLGQFLNEKATTTVFDSVFASFSLVFLLKMSSPKSRGMWKFFNEFNNYLRPVIFYSLSSSGDGSTTIKWLRSVK